MPREQGFGPAIPHLRQAPYRVDRRVEASAYFRSHFGPSLLCTLGFTRLTFRPRCFCVEKADALSLFPHGRVGRLIAATTGDHFEGLRAVACALLRRGAIGVGLANELRRLDDAASVARHIDVEW